METALSSFTYPIWVYKTHIFQEWNCRLTDTVKDSITTPSSIIIPPYYKESNKPTPHPGCLKKLIRRGTETDRCSYRIYWPLYPELLPTGNCFIQLNMPNMIVLQLKAVTAQHKVHVCWWKSSSCFPTQSCTFPLGVMIAMGCYMLTNAIPNKGRFQ